MDEKAKCCRLGGKQGEGFRSAEDLGGTTPGEGRGGSRIGEGEPSDSSAGWHGPGSAPWAAGVQGYPLVTPH